MLRALNLKRRFDRLRQRHRKGPGKHHHHDHPRHRHHHCLAGFPIVLISCVVFMCFAGAGLAVGFVVRESQEAAIVEEALALAMETGQFFSEKLDKAIRPLFSMAQFAVHLESFNSLPDRIGMVGEPGALPLNSTTWRRNITGVCDDQELVNTFVSIATTLKLQSQMEDILVNIQLSPNGVVCLLHPMMDMFIDDFDKRQFMDNTPAWGLDLFNDPSFKYGALHGITRREVGVTGPHQFVEYPDRGPLLIARLPIVDDRHQIVVDGVAYARWGFATALIAWMDLVEQSGIYETFRETGFEFQLTRTDSSLSADTMDYEESVVVLAETPSFSSLDRWNRVSSSVETTNNEWIMTVAYDSSSVRTIMGLVIGSCMMVACFIAILIYTILSQKHVQAAMQAESSAQEAKVNTERDVTAYFAHELRNRKFGK